MAVPAINLNRFDLVSLRVFAAAVEAGSLTAGAARFGISLAAASKRVAELEAHVGQPLLTRSKRGVAPTPAGLTLHRHAIEVLSRLEQLSVAMADFHRGSGGHLRLWANTSAFTGFLPALLARYCAACPEVTLDLEDVRSEDAVRAVARGSAELGIVDATTPAEGLEAIVCDTDELVLLMPADHPLARRDPVPVREVLRHDVVGLDRATSLMRRLSHAAEAAARPLRIRVQVRGFDAMCRMIAEGVGLGILPRRSVLPHVKSMGLAIARLSGMDTERRLSLVMRRRAALSPPAAAFVAMALGEADR